MIDLKALQAQVRHLEDDLRPTGLADTKLKQEWQEAHQAQRTAAAYEDWLKGRITQVAVAWVLGTVFVRFCEDNGLIEFPFIAGRGERTALARDLQQAFVERNPAKDQRDWLSEAFDAMSVSPVAAGLFDREHNPMWTIPPTPFAAKDLLEFWRETDATGEVIRDFTDPEWNTRFLGDLYQDLSEDARKAYALLQTPEFVEEFILNYTLAPAIEEFGLEPEPPYGHADLPHRLRVIDPACGSGHFLLGAFRRLLAAWQSQPGDIDKWVLISRALESVHGVDKNPFAVAIARFRLMLAAMRAGDVKRLTAKVDFPLNIAVGDSLLHGKGAIGIQDEFDFASEQSTHTYRTEDIDKYIKSDDILTVGSYHVVVGNPPYIPANDPKENQNYRKAYKSCSGAYHLSVPFTERIFQLSIRGSQNGSGAGYAGLITDNAFMKRDFGKRLIQEYFPNVDLTYVIDTSGVHIPGHGTPTVILIGRRRYPRSDSTIRTVLGIRGESSRTAESSPGPAWKAIIDQINEPGSEGEWVSVVDLERDRLAQFPWNLSGGGSSILMASLEISAHQRLRQGITAIGRTTHTGLDEAFYIADASVKTRGLGSSCVPVVLGGGIRDFGLTSITWTMFPYDDRGRDRTLSAAEESVFWPNRTVLRSRVDFGQRPEERGLRWFDHSMFFPHRFATPLGIAYAFKASHNHFTLDRGGKVFKQTAPVIKLPDGASEDEHFALLGVLNSSSVCFWLRQNSQHQGGGAAEHPWSWTYEFSGGIIKDVPLPNDLPLEFGRALDELAQRLLAVEPSAVCAGNVPTGERLATAFTEHGQIQGRMIALQEELDWDVYRRYGLLGKAEAAELIAKPDSIPDLRLGERAFEIVLARQMEKGELETQWFARHRSTPITKIPEHWPQKYREVVAKRIEAIERNRNIGLIERPECKRRWQSEPWETKESAALRNWLLDQCEERSLWYGPDGQSRVMTVNRLADRLRSNADVVSVARLLKGPDAELAEVLKDVIDDEHVPYLAQLRYKGEGLLKRALWERTWDLQREEDRTSQRLDIPVPPKYTSVDFIENSYWRHRGMLDVPKERFLSYHYASPDSDDSLLLGWAGWDHREQAHALTALIEERSITDGWEISRLKPLMAGLAEVMPWVRQWHAEVDDRFGASPADAYDSYLVSQREKYGLAEDDMHSWHPPQPASGRRRT